MKQSLIEANNCSEDYFEPKVLRLDLLDTNDIEEYARRAQTLHGWVDVVINNAGISYRGRAAETSVDVDRHVMNVNYFGQLALIKGETLVRLPTHKWI